MYECEKPVPVQSNRGQLKKRFFIRVFNMCDPCDRVFNMCDPCDCVFVLSLVYDVSTIRRNCSLQRIHPNLLNWPTDHEPRQASVAWGYEPMAVFKDPYWPLRVAQKLGTGFEDSVEGPT
ncbi:hypothetical protein NDU88_012849 [Pleurodeles waltl]|uniref:Uncharacterized protein n=1 Tax=Pleurodeles waltl TaxID=8319 RepID=A0AAV7R745_PLEWA|nr:hypothetical protein NDU88_012849 [Pleurodeles waltl]